MPSDRKPPQLPDLSAIIDGLAEAGIEFIIVGGIAAVVQGAPVTTLDVDIVHRQTRENISKLFSFLKSINAVYRCPDDKVIAPVEEDLFEMGHMLLTTRLGPLDVLAFIEEGRTYDDLFENAVEIEFRAHKIRVLDIRTLTALKRRSSSPKDKQRLAVLEETLRQLSRQTNLPDD
jgi:hypothetical protein